MNDRLQEIRDLLKELKNKIKYKSELEIEIKSIKKSLANLSFFDFSEKNNLNKKLKDKYTELSNTKNEIENLSYLIQTKRGIFSKKVRFFKLKRFF